MEGVKSLLLLLVLLCCVLIVCSGWRRMHHRCFACRGWASNQFIYCPWCGQMQFAKARKRAWGSRQRPRASAQPQQDEHPAPPPARRSKRRTVVLSEKAGEAAESTVDDRAALRLAGEAAQTTVRTSSVPPPRCPGCHHLLQSGEVYCGHCGRRIARPQEPW